MQAGFVVDRDGWRIGEMRPGKEWPAVYAAGIFNDRMDAPGGHGFENLFDAGRPADSNVSGGFGRAQSEVQFL